MAPPTKVAAAAAAADKQPLTLVTLTKVQKRKLQSLSRPDEMFATLGVLNMLVTVIVATKAPAHYWIWHLARTLFYLPTRYLRFRAKKMELYLLDWCYMVTYLSTVCAILAFCRVTFGISTPLVHYNTDFIHAGFAMASGPLAWSVFIFRNSIVFHDVEYSTSVFIHLSPFVLFWCLRWGAGTPSVILDSYPAMHMVCETREDFAAADACFQSLRGMLWCRACSASPFSFVVAPAALYVGVWSVPYFLIILVHWRNWCQETKRETLYDYLCQIHPELMGWCAKTVEPVVGETYAGPIGYMTLHFCVMIAFCSTSFMLWHSFLLHTTFMVVILAKAIDNGSSYMFRVFAYRYAQDCLDTNRKTLD